MSDTKTAALDRPPIPVPGGRWTVVPGFESVAIGTTVRLRAVRHLDDSDEAALAASSPGGLWSLVFTPRGGAVGRDVTELLSETTGVSTSFVTDADGIYVATFTGQGGFLPSRVATATVDSGQTTVAVAVKSDPGEPGHQRMFYSWWRLGQGGTAWRAVDLPGEVFRTDAAPAVTVVGNYLFLLAKGLDGELYLNQGEIGKPFVGWRLAHFRTDVAAALTTTASTP